MSAIFVDRWIILLIYKKIQLLIKTIPTRKLIDLFKNFVKNNLDERLYDLKLSDVQDDTNDNRRLTDIILQSDEKQ